MTLPSWMYSQIINDPSVKAVWCYCNAPAVSYCRGSQFVCERGHWGMPMVTLKVRRAQKYLREQCAKARQLRAA